MLVLFVLAMSSLDFCSVAWISPRRSISPSDSIHSREFGLCEVVASAKEVMRLEGFACMRVILSVNTTARKVSNEF